MGRNASGILAWLGVLVIIGATAWRVVVHPEWTEAETLCRLWWAFLGGLLLAFAGMMLGTTKKGSEGTDEA